VSGNYEIYTIEEDGSDLRRITFNGVTDQYPAWSPDGKKLAVVRNWMTESEIFIINADGSGEKQVTKMGDLTVFARDLAWSPDGRTIAFAAAPTGVGSLDVYVVQSNGSGFARLTSAEGDDQHPAWTSDGKRIAYSSYGGNPAQPPEIYSMDRQGSNVLVETDCTIGCYYPAWSPDGTRLAYNEGNTLKIRELATSYVWTFGDDIVAAAWSPDAVRLVYTPAYVQGTIMVVNADMSDPTTLVAFVNSLAGADADWGR
jgi:TolB protein